MVPWKESEVERLIGWMDNPEQLRGKQLQHYIYSIFFKACTLLLVRVIAAVAIDISIYVVVRCALEITV